MLKELNREYFGGGMSLTINLFVWHVLQVSTVFVFFDEVCKTMKY